MSSAAILLVGGLSTRMGRDKTGLVWRGRPLLQHLCEEATRASDAVWVVARADQSLPALPHGVERLDDPPTDRGAGPLAAAERGLAAARQAGIARAYVGACDMPRQSATHLRFVLAFLDQHAAAVPVEGEIVHALSGAMRVDDALRRAVALRSEGKRSMQALYRALGAWPIPLEALPDPAAVIGFNTPEEWARATAES